MAGLCEPQRALGKGELGVNKDGLGDRPDPGLAEGGPFRVGLG